MEDIDSKSELKERLLAAGIDEIVTHGVKDFSLRRVAAACGASCAAPYKHFKNKDDFVLQIIDYVHDKWELLRTQIAEAFDNPDERIVELCVASVRFKLANPLYGINEKSFDREILAEVRSLCQNRGYDDTEERIFTIASVSWGTASLIEAGKLSNEPETFDMLRKKLLSELV